MARADLHAISRGSQMARGAASTGGHRAQMAKAKKNAIAQPSWRATRKALRVQGVIAVSSSAAQQLKSGCSRANSDFAFLEIGPAEITRQSTCAPLRPCRPCTGTLTLALQQRFAAAVARTKNQPHHSNTVAQIRRQQGTARTPNCHGVVSVFGRHGRVRHGVYPHIASRS